MPSFVKEEDMKVKDTIMGTVAEVEPDELREHLRGLFPDKAHEGINAAIDGLCEEVAQGQLYGENENYLGVEIVID